MSNHVRESRAINRLHMQYAREKAERVGKPPPKRLELSTAFRGNQRAPRPVETPDDRKDRQHLRGPQSMSLLWSAGIQRSSVELNSMRPMQRLGNGSGWSLMQYPVAVIPAAAFVRDVVSISVSPLPRVPPDQSLHEHIDDACAAALPPDGAVYLSGRLIVEAPTDRDSVGIEISIPLVGSPSWSWSGWPYRYVGPADQGVSWSASIGDHHIDGDAYAHKTPQLTLGIDHKKAVSRSRKVGVYEISVWRAAAGATTFADIIRKI